MTRIKADYHTHTTYSDGKGRVLDNVRAARKKGIMTLAISDHGWGHGFFGLKKNLKEDYFREIEEARRIFPDMKILKAIECNILGADGALDISPEEMKEFDLILCGYHFGSRPRGLGDLFMHAINGLNKHTGLFKRRVIEKNTQAILRAMDHPIDILTHPGDKGQVDILPIAKKAGERGIKLEINERHNHLDLQQLKMIKDMEVDFILSSDAHYPEAIGQVEEAYSKILQSGLDLGKIKNLREVK